MCRAAAQNRARPAALPRRRYPVLDSRVDTSTTAFAETEMIDEPSIDEQTMLVWDSLEFEAERVLIGSLGEDTVSIGHPAFIRYEDGPARLELEPIDLQNRPGRVRCRWIDRAALPRDTRQRVRHHRRRPACTPQRWCSHRCLAPHQLAWRLVPPRQPSPAGSVWLWRGVGIADSL